jgi:cobalt-zinc-cadmium efflux system membrane fusion protein
VRQGQVIAEVEQPLPATEKTQFASQAAQLQTEAVQAEQEVAFRQTELERAKQLYEGGAISLKQLQTAEFNLKQAQARSDGARRAKAQLEAAISSQNTGPRRAPILAPISGSVIAADAAAGEQVDPAKSLLTIADLSSVWVEAAIHESQLQSVRRAPRAEVTTPASPGRIYAGSLVTISQVLDPEHRTVKVIYAVNNADGSLKLGLAAEARIPMGSPRRVLLIPASAVLQEENQSLVFVESAPGVYRRRAITTGERRGDQIVVSSGLALGEQVVSSGAASLRSETLKGQIPTEVEERR